jgi:hypothetical protein
VGKQSCAIYSVTLQIMYNKVRFGSLVLTWESSRALYGVLHYIAQ